MQVAARCLAKRVESDFQFVGCTRIGKKVCGVKIKILNSKLVKCCHEWKVGANCFGIW